MLRFFRSTGVVVIVVIFIIGVFSWFHVFNKPEIITFGGSDFFLFNWLTNIPVAVLGLVLFLAVAFILVHVNTRLRLIEKFSYLPALCYVLLIGGVPEIHLYSPVIIAAILLVIAFAILVGSFESERLSYSFFTVSAIISFATFFYQYMYVFMPVVWITIAAWRPGYWREWVFSVLGFALPYFFAFSWFFLIDGDLNKMSVLFEEIFTLQSGVPVLSFSFAVFFSASIMLVIFTLWYTLRYIGSKKTTIRTSYYVLILIAAFTVSMALIVPDNISQAWYLLAFPMSFTISCYLANVKSMRWGTFVLAIFFAGVVIAQAVYLSEW